jgi:hypothetical protein
VKLLAAAALILAAALPAAAQPQTQTPQTQTRPQTPKERCAQLIAYFDRYGVGRSLNSDGRRNHTRISAEVDCSKGLYAEGIAEMEALLIRKKFTPPPPGPNVPEDDD